MVDDLVTYLDAVDERLLNYLDAQKDLGADTVRRLQRFVVAMSEGSMTPELAREDWVDFYPLAAAFVVACGSEELGGLYDQSTVLNPVVDGRFEFTDSDRVFLVMLSDELERYAEARHH